MSIGGENSYESLRTHRSTYEHLQITTDIFAHLLICIRNLLPLYTYGHIAVGGKRFMDIYGHLWTHEDTYGHLWTPTDTYDHLRTPTNTYEHLRTPTDTYGHLRTPTDTYEHIRTPYGHVSVRNTT